VLQREGRGESYRLGGGGGGELLLRTEKRGRWGIRAHLEGKGKVQSKLSKGKREEKVAWGERSTISGGEGRKRGFFGGKNTSTRRKKKEKRSRGKDGRYAF